MLRRASEMTFRAHAWPLKLRRLFLAAAQLLVACVLVLALPKVAKAEEAAPPTQQKAVGMCGTSAQSIAAPPPIYPTSDAAARPCAPPAQELHRGAPVLPTDVPATVDLDGEKSAVLPSALTFPKRVTMPGPRGASLARPGEEHRGSAERPPRR